MFALANNQIQSPSGKAWFSAVAYNPTDHEIELDVRGILFAPNVTTVSGNVSASYQWNVFAGPHAVVSSSWLDFTPGRNGAFTRRVRIPARTAAVLAESPHLHRTEIFALLDITAPWKSDLFRLANVASLQPLTGNDLASIVAGKFPAAGKPEDYAWAGPTRYGRPHGVASMGCVFRGGRTIELRPGESDGDLVFATRFRHVGTPTDLPQLEHVLPNPAGIGPAATTDDGSYGMSYVLRYQVRNPTDGELQVVAALTSPRDPQDADLKPLGGIMTQAVRCNGERFNLRVDERGSGKVITGFRIPAGETRTVTVEFTHFGNTFPPAGLEFRALR